jgi:hypothetical protein
MQKFMESVYGRLGSHKLTVLVLGSFSARPPAPYFLDNALHLR